MNATAGVSKRVLGELGEVVKKTAKDTVQAGSDIAKGTIETVVGGGSSLQNDSAMRQVEQGTSGPAADPLQVIKQQAAIKKKRGLQRVREELARYIEKKKQEEAREEMIEERQVEIKKEQEEQRKESEREQIIRQAQRDYGGSREGIRKKH